MGIRIRKERVARLNFLAHQIYSVRFLLQNCKNSNDYSKSQRERGTCVQLWHSQCTQAGLLKFVVKVLTKEYNISWQMHALTKTNQWPSTRALEHLLSCQERIKGVLVPSSRCISLLYSGHLRKQSHSWYYGGSMSEMAERNEYQIVVVILMM